MDTSEPFKSGFFSRRCVGPIVFGLVAIFIAFFLWGLFPRGGGVAIPFTIVPGDGFLEIAGRLKSEHLIRSKAAFEMWALLTGGAIRIKAGTYLLSPGMSVPKMVALLTSERRQVEVRIPEGFTVFGIDELLAERGIIVRGALIAHVSSSLPLIEGTLFPDTYLFFEGSSVSDVLAKFSTNFEANVAPILQRNSGDKNEILILASLLEREVPDAEDRRIVAGIILKRIAVGMPIQIDATICYAKEVLAGAAVPCSSLARLDFKIDSPYNTYLRKGWPPGPIGNPSNSALEAAGEPKSSPYWFYLSDPKTKKTIFSRTLDEHTRNRVKYLSQ